jgi:hypothetical protein
MVSPAWKNGETVYLPSDVVACRLSSEADGNNPSFHCFSTMMWIP